MPGMLLISANTAENKRTTDNGPVVREIYIPIGLAIR